MWAESVDFALCQAWCCVCIPCSSLEGVGSPASLPKFQHPSHQLLKANGFKQQQYYKYRHNCYKGEWEWEWEYVGMGVGVGLWRKFDMRVGLEEGWEWEWDCGARFGEMCGNKMGRFMKYWHEYVVLLLALLFTHYRAEDAWHWSVP